MNLRALLTPVFIAVAASIAAFAMLVFFAAGEQDDQSLNFENAVLHEQKIGFSNNLVVLAIDNTWWDTAVEKIMLSEDLDWITSTIGESINDIEYLDGTIFVRPDLSLIYGFHSTQSKGAELAPQALLASPIKGVLNKLDITDDDKQASAYGLLEIEGRLIAYGASLVRPIDETMLPAPKTTRRPILIFYSVISPDEISAIGKKNAIQNLRFSIEKPAASGIMPLYGPENRVIGWLGWTSQAPGTEMAKKMVPPAVLLLVLVVLAMIRFVNRATLLVDGLEQASKSKSAFLASMSHEVRTPLNSILGFSELMSLELFGKIEGKKNKEYLELIKGSGNHLLTIINDILDISKLEAGKFDIYAEEIRPGPIVAECVHMMEPSAQDREITVTSYCEGTVIFSDERILRQILINILSNAIKFTQKGGAVHISGKRKLDFFRIRVTDNGIGMSEADIETALSIFGQTHSEHAKKYTKGQSGTGLGLPLVKRFVTLLDGTMDISSTPNKGTSVTLNFPLKTTAKNL